MDEPELKRTELCYITSTDKTTRTFFAQLCKNTNEELLNHNKKINEHCQKITAQAEKKIHKGDLVCARFPDDGQWYRSLVLSRDKVKQVYSVIFVDYGNLSTISSDDMLLVSSTVLPDMGRAPFGISCIFKGSENYTEEEVGHLLECLSQNYVMVKVLERQTKLQWIVDIPKHAYNIPFWQLFKPEPKESGGPDKLVGEE